MRRQLVVLIAVLSLALPLYPGDDQNEKNDQSVVTLTFDAEAPEVVSSVSWGIAAVATRTDAGAVAGNTEFKELTFTKPLSKSSKKLFGACATGVHLKKVVLEVSRKAGSKPKEYFVITMKEILITRYSVSSQSDVPTETVSLLSADVDYEILSGQ
jgi:type VI secretion system Hcp family effector